jgi:asparagine synthase (glutamine-hydrolysing)
VRVNHYLGSIRRSAAPADGRSPEPVAAELVSDGFSRVDKGSRTALLVGYVAGTNAESQRRLLEDFLVRSPHDVGAALDWEGNFTLISLDASAPRLAIYRNFISTAFTYYTLEQDTLLFASTMSALLAASGRPARVRGGVLPSLFLYRFVSGPATMADRVYRLEPGELLTFAGEGLRVERVRTLGDLRGDPIPPGPAVAVVERTMADVLTDIRAHAPDATNLLSGGVDSSYIQAIWNRDHPGTPRSACAALKHDMTRLDLEYAVEVPRLLATEHRIVEVDEPMGQLLPQTIQAIGEMPNHVQSCYYGFLARKLRQEGVSAVLCGEGADSLFGTGMAIDYRLARRWRRLLPAPWLRRLAGKLASITGHATFSARLALADACRDPYHWLHPYNLAGAFADYDALRDCFTGEEIREAFRRRHEYMAGFAGPDDVLSFAHNMAIFCEGANTAATWTALSQGEGVRMYCPYLDSRFLGVAMNFTEDARFDPSLPKATLKHALEGYLPQEIVRRGKLGFGQPIFEWLSAGGQLRELVDEIGKHEFAAPAVVTRLKEHPTWFLYVLLCFDIWYKEHVAATPEAAPDLSS